MKKEHVLTSFDKTEKTPCFSVRPEKYDDLISLRGQPIIARGSGLSYGSASVASDATVVDMTRMNRILDFDESHETVTVETGIRIGELHNFLLSKGYILPVLPGYPTITIGGCIGFNVHGKSQFRVGTFGDWVIAMQLFHPEKGEIQLSRYQNMDVFDLTIGGMGLTGIVLSATLKIKKVPGLRLSVKLEKIRNVFEAVNLMQKNSPSFEYVYSWNNFNRYRHNFGKGYVYLEDYDTGNSSLVSFKDRISCSYKSPGIQNPMFIRWMNEIYSLMGSLRNQKESISLSSGSFPIYGKEIYFNLFGKKGFREYQVLFSWDQWERAFEELESMLQRSRHPIALGSLKIFKGRQHNLSFCGDGVCLTLDVSATKNSVRFFERLDELCLKYNGIPNLSKDSRLSSSMIMASFPAFLTFRRAILEFDPNNLIRSELKKRIGLT
jgi:decaprenylphospho-beta-D-ribofuranose 2-oxidase